MHVNALALLPVFHPLTIVVATIVALPCAFTLLHPFLPLPDVNFLIKPAKLAMTLAIAVSIATFVDSLACGFYAFGFETVAELTLIERPLTDKYTTALSLSINKLAQVKCILIWNDRKVRSLN